MGLYRYKGKKQDFVPFKLKFVPIIAKKLLRSFFMDSIISLYLSNWFIGNHVSGGEYAEAEEKRETFFVSGYGCRDACGKHDRMR